MRYRRSIIKWFFLAAGVLFTLIALKPSLATISHGMIAAGFFLAFAVLDGLDRLAPIIGQRNDNSPPSPPPPVH